MMKRIGLLMAVGLLGGCNMLAQMFGGQGQNVDEAGGNEFSMEEDGGGGESFSGSLRELFGRGQSMTCTITSMDEAGNRTDGEVYLDGKQERMRGEFIMTQADGNSFDGEVINDGEWTYAWSSLQPQGTKFRDVDFEDDDSSEARSKTPFNEDDEADFECRPWRVDSSMFVPPRDIEFVDIGAQIEQIQEATDGFEGAACSACDALSGEQKSQCLQALGC